MDKLIEAENISFSYGYKPVFEKVGFTLNKGDFGVLLGTNGSGKSTLLKLILGELAPASGSLRLFGEDQARFKNWERIGYMAQVGFQSGTGFPATAEEIVKANLYSTLGLFRFPGKAHREKALQALKSVGMADYARSLIGNLSGGQQQRLMLARVLVNDPELLLLDEPTSGVDSDAVDVLYELLDKLNRERKMTLLLITHDAERVLPHVSRQFAMNRGTLREIPKRTASRDATSTNITGSREV